MSIFEIVLKMYNLNNNRKNHKNDASLSYNKSNYTDEISPVDNNEIQNFGTKISSR